MTRSTAAPPRSHRAARRLAGLAAVGALMLAPVVPAAAADPVSSAAEFLAGALADGTHMTSTSQGQTFTDPGLTADVVIGLTAAGADPAKATAATGWLEQNVASYVGPGAGKPSTTGDKAGAAYAGALAKAALVAQVRGLSAADFGGRDLLAELAARESGGRFSDDSTFGDYSNAITQSLALIVQQRSGKAPSAPAVAALVGLQCTDGGFRLAFPEQGKQEPCVSDNDATGYAVQALLPISPDQAGKALDYLVKVQQADGGFANTAPAGAKPVINANTTGLAGAALAAGGRNAQADKAIAFLTGLQQSNGAVAYAAETTDKTSEPRATSGALLAFAHVNLVTLTAAAAGSPSGASSATVTSSAASAASVSSAASAAPTGLPTASSDAASSPSASSAATTPETTAASHTGDSADSGSSAAVWWIVGGIVVVLLVVGVVVVARRRSARR